MGQLLKPYLFITISNRASRHTDGYPPPAPGEGLALLQNLLDSPLLFGLKLWVARFKTEWRRPGGAVLRDGFERDAGVRGGAGAHHTARPLLLRDLFASRLLSVDVWM